MSDPPVPSPTPAAAPAGQTPILAHASAQFPPLFKNRNFLLLWLAYVISALGDRIHFLVMLRLLENLKNPGLHPSDANWYKIGTQETAQLNIMMLLPFLLLQLPASNLCPYRIIVGQLNSDQIALTPVSSLVLRCL